MRRPTVVLAIVLVLAGCGTAPDPSHSPSAPVQPSLEVPPLDPRVLGVTCGNDLVFHPALLSAPGRAETEPDAAAEALRTEIVRGRPIPKSGWVRVTQLADTVQFVARNADGQSFTKVVFELQDGAWKQVVKAPCPLELDLPEGVTIAKWRLDPALPAPNPGDRTIHVLINERACSGGRSPEGRVDPPIIERGPEAVTITILVHEIPGGNECPGNPDFAMPVELPEPLGGRPLFDGGVFPPFGPIAAYALDCGPMGMADCVRFAQQTVADAERQRPGHHVTWVYISDADGDDQLAFEDGTIIGADIN